MKPDDEADVDERLAALKSALESVPAPARRVATTASAPVAVALPPSRPSGRAAERLGRRSLVWPTLGVAASLLIAVAAFLRPWSAGQPEAESVPVEVPVAARTRGDYLAAPILVPVAVHSTTRGPELHYLDARIVRDSHGSTRVVFVHSFGEE